MKNIKAKLFEKQTNIELEVRKGKLYFDGSIDLKGANITFLPNNLTINGDLDVSYTKIKFLPKSLKVNGDLDLSGTDITFLPDDLIIGNSLNLSNTRIKSLPNNFIINGYLDLENCINITSLPDNLIVGDYLDLKGTRITSLPDNLIVGGSLDLENCTEITSLPDNFTVGGDLDLSGSGIKSLPNNLTVGGSLYLKNTCITSLPNNLTIGGIIYLDGITITNNLKVNQNINLLQWQNGKYIKVDGIFTEVIKKQGNVYKVKEINSEEIYYVVTDGDGNYAHGDTIKEAKEDLIYKISNRNISDYKNLTLDSELTYSEAIKCYRVISGACAFGVKNFVNKKLNKKKKPKYTIAEIIKLTKGEYGNEDFARFFSSKIH